MPGDTTNPQLQKPELPNAPVIAAPEKITAPVIAAPSPAAPLSQLPKVNTPTVQPLPKLAPDQTVEGRVAKMTTTRSPLLAAASLRAKQRMAARGLLNTSLAEQAGTQAVIETATPIAAQDAAAEQRARELQFQAEQQNQAEARAAERNRLGILFQAKEKRSSDALLAEERRNVAQAGLVSQYDLAQYEAERRTSEANADIAARYGISAYQIDATSYENELARQWTDNNVDIKRQDSLAGQYRTDVFNESRYWDDQRQVVANTPDSVMSKSDKSKRLKEINALEKAGVEGITATYAASPMWDSSWEIEFSPDAVNGGSTTDKYKSTDFEPVKNDAGEVVRTPEQLAADANKFQQLVETAKTFSADMKESPIFFSELKGEKTFGGQESFRDALGKFNQNPTREDAVKLAKYLKFQLDESAAQKGRSPYDMVVDNIEHQDKWGAKYSVDKAAYDGFKSLIESYTSRDWDTWLEKRLPQRKKA